MSRLSAYNRNHSFPPSIRYVQKPSKSLSQPLPDIDDEPWAHFLAQDEDEDEQFADYLHFDAGILAGSETQKRKANKFRSFSVEADRNIKHHHGALHRRQLEHGFLSQQRLRAQHEDTDRPIPASKRSLAISASGGSARRQMVRRHSGHRHSWQEPSLFTVTEEVPRIVVSDYDDDNSSVNSFTSTDSLGESLSENSGVASEEAVPQSSGVATETAPAAPPSPRMMASIHPAEKSDSQLNQMWLVERARL
ncbi:uncharacterized protein PV09_04390 [Verruconis gallopava]|uniref:Uncharacterized protein n=1 Tax=Verruconis gallopava TaxID=253628 RepID=A0A0D2ADV6_9PEZI|nr:uncharacterized protein PV09_04390 [Verruconis gallopava]KIW04645.1 hypothetical protein PV09_04390 [Verruconis gallopava]